MGTYRPLYNIRIEHEYFDGNICRAMQCRISPSGQALCHRRGLLFRQTGTNEWTILYDDAGAGVDTLSDVLALELVMADPAFVLYTQWNGFQPSSAYRLEPSGRAGNAGSDGRHRGAVCQSADRKGILHGTAPPDRRGILLCQGGNAGDRLSAVPCPRIPVGIPFRLPWRRKILSGKTPAGGMRRQTDIRAVRGGGRIWQGSAAYRFPRKDSPAETVRVPAPSDIRHRRRQPPQTGVAAQCGTAQAGRFPEQSPGVTPAVMLFLDCNPLHITRLLNH